MEFRCRYPKDEVYPGSGGEFQLEQLRATFPQYKPSFPPVDDGSCDMEMTTICPAEISTMVPVSGTKEFHGGHSSYNSAGAGLSTAAVDPAKANNCPTSQMADYVPVKLPLASQEGLEHGRWESERGHAVLENKRGFWGGVGKEGNQENDRRGGGNLKDERISKNQENSFKIAAGNQENNCSRKHWDNDYTLEQKSCGHQQGKLAPENLPVRQPFGFTPSAIHGSVPTPSSCHPACVSTKLNFSEVESSLLSTSSTQLSTNQRQHHSTYKGPSSENSLLYSSSKEAPRKNLIGFDVSSDLEAKAKFLMETKQNSENEFAMTEFEVPKKPSQVFNNRKVLGALGDDISQHNPPRGTNFAESQLSFNVYADSMVSADESSFVPFQDESCMSVRRGQAADKSGKSVLGMSRAKENRLFSHAQSNFIPPPRGHSKITASVASKQMLSSSRKALQELPATSGAPVQQQQQQWDRQDYALPQESFSVYAPSQDESSFVPYCDTSNMSVAGSEAPPPAPPPSFSSSAVVQRQLGKVGPAASEEFPQLGGFLETTQFTQFDIKHPSTYDPSSTPHQKNQRKNLSFNLSVISSDMGKEIAESSRSGSAHHLTQPLAAKPAMCLSTIAEESSGKSKLTVSSSRSSNTTTSSSTVSNGSGVDCDVSATLENPFVPGIVNRMINRLGGIPSGFVEEMAPEESLCINEGDCLQLGGVGEVYDSLSILPGRKDRLSSTIYQCCSGVSTNSVLHVLKHGGEWAVTASYHCQNRLAQMGLGDMADAFPKYQQVCLYMSPSNVAVTVSDFHRHGSLLDLMEYRQQHKVVVPEMVVVYICASMLSAVSALHKVGFVHTHISPRHFLLHDISDPKFLDRATVVRLIDFKYCVDVNQFGEDHVFVGCPMTMEKDLNGPWLSPLLKERRPWRWQVDYYGLAVSMLALITGKTGKPPLVQDQQTGQYSCQNLPRSFDVPMWHNLLNQLLNTNGWTDLDQWKAQLVGLINVVRMKTLLMFLAKKL